MKKRLFKILSTPEHQGDLSWWVDIFIVSLIALNVLAIILESVGPIYNRYEALFNGFEVFSVAVFTIEYILRVWTANEDPRFKKPVTGNLQYALTPMAIVDLLAVLPFYLPLLGLDLRFLRILRLFRLFRIFKIARYMTALKLMHKALHDKREELWISFIFTLFILLIASTMMYYVENNAQPDKFSSIPQTMWWGIATLTTVGYGDVYPITPVGKVLGGCIAIIGIGLFALPAGILASGFSEQLTKGRKSRNACPECGRPFEEQH